MGYDHGLVERIADALNGMGERGIRQKNVFGGRGFLLGRSTFAIAWGDGQTLLREALLIADHNAYHIGQLVLVRRLLGEWTK